MIATPQVPILELPEEASSTVVQAAKNAASNQHALINLIRLIKSLEAKADEDDFPTESFGIKKEWETVLYARALLDALKLSNEQSSSTLSTLSGLEKELKSVESSFRYRLTSPTPTPSLNPALIALPMTPNPSNPPQHQPTSAVPLPSQGHHLHPSKSSAPPQTPVPVSVPVTDGIRKRRSKVDEYLAQRSKSALSESSEDGLLPLKTIIKPKLNSYGNTSGDRDALFAGSGSGARNGISSAQLHEELGGQLADMSTQLKLNAIQFANSLENEKGVFDSTQNTLENNLATTKSSKQHLSTVSSKGRSTTCLTLGVVIVVMVLFIWTYMLIRFT